MATPTKALRTAVLAAASAGIAGANVYEVPPADLDGQPVRDVKLVGVQSEGFDLDKATQRYECRATWQVIYNPFLEDGGKDAYDLVSDLEALFAATLSVAGFTVQRQEIEAAAVSSETLVGQAGEELHEGRVTVFYIIT